MNRINNKKAKRWSRRDGRPAMARSSATAAVPDGMSTNRQETSSTSSAEWESGWQWVTPIGGSRGTKKDAGVDKAMSGRQVTADRYNRHVDGEDSDRQYWTDHDEDHDGDDDEDDGGDDGYLSYIVRQDFDGGPGRDASSHNVTAWPVTAGQFDDVLLDQMYHEVLWSAERSENAMDQAWSRVEWFQRTCTDDQFWQGSDINDIYLELYDTRPSSERDAIESQRLTAQLEFIESISTCEPAQVTGDGQPVCAGNGIESVVHHTSDEKTVEWTWGQATSFACVDEGTGPAGNGCVTSVHRDDEESRMWCVAAF